MSKRKRWLAVLAVAVLLAAAMGWYIFVPVVTATRELWNPYDWAEIKIYRNHQWVMTTLDGETTQGVLSPAGYTLIAEALELLKPARFPRQGALTLDGALYTIVYAGKASYSDGSGPSRVVAILWEMLSATVGE